MVRNIIKLKIQNTPIRELLDLDNTMAKRSPLAATAAAVKNVQAMLQPNYWTWRRWNGLMGQIILLLLLGKSQL